ncbi:hypothetical protein QJQ45_002509 [Haematococcus lacustris]|nr:hypothetical protein QJQ45_002509 [Haematococcus lacustris]
MLCCYAQTAMLNAELCCRAAEERCCAATPNCELCFWPERGALPAKGKEYPGLGYKRLRDKPPRDKAQPAATKSKVTARCLASAGVEARSAALPLFLAPGHVPYPSSCVRLLHFSSANQRESQ